MVTSLFKCQNCGLKRTVNVTPAQLSKKVQCSQCGHIGQLQSSPKKVVVQKQAPAPAPAMAPAPPDFVKAVFRCGNCKFEKLSNYKATYIGQQARCPQCQSPGTISSFNAAADGQAVPAVDNDAVSAGRFTPESLSEGKGPEPQKSESSSPDLVATSAPQVLADGTATVGDAWTMSLQDVPPKAHGYTIPKEPLGDFLSSQKYKSLLRRYPTQDFGEMFAFFPYDKKRRESWISPFQQLSNMAKPEYWNFQRDEFKRGDNNIPILINYLNFTFVRLLQQQKIRLYGDKACFNTGLQTMTEKDIYAVFSKNRKDTAEDWYFNGWVDSYDPKLNIFRPSLPPIASYTDDLSNLFFDTSYDLDLNISHIVNDPKNRERLPESIRDNSKLAMSAIQDEARAFKERCIRNYKLAVPCWYPAHSKVQLLLPVYINDRTRADLALVADKDSKSKLYKIRTALTIDMAYSNARLITRPDREWLNP